MNDTFTITYITAVICLFGTAGFTFIVCGLLFGGKTDDYYESQLELKDNKIDALCYDNERLQETSQSRLNEMLKLKKNSKIKDAAIKTLTETLNQNEDFWMAKAIQKLENNGGLKITMEGK